MARFFEVALDALGALVVALDKGPALVQVIPIDLSAAVLRDDSGRAGEAQLACFLGPAAHVGLGHRLVIQRPDQMREGLVCLLAGLFQRFEGLGGEGCAAHHGGGRALVMFQGNRVEDAFDDPQLGHVGEVTPGQRPQLAPVAIARFEARFLLTEALGAVDQAFPIAAIRHCKAHSGAADAQVPVPVVLLAECAIEQLQAEATGHFQIGAGCSGGVVRG